MVKYSYINKLNGCVANFKPQQLSDYESANFDDAAVQPVNSYYDPVPKYINGCMYEEENVWQRKHKDKKLCLHSFKCGIVSTLSFRLEG